MKEITLEQWDNIVNKKDEFVLPKKWCVQVTKENRTIINEWKQQVNPGSEIAGLYNEFVNYQGFNDNMKPKYTEITFEQFKKYVLKQDNMKEIIGYKLIKPEYSVVARNIAGVASFGLTSVPGVDFTQNSISYDKLKTAGVLDLWFEPVYKEEKTLPRINGYDGALEKSYVVYGCVKFNIKYIEELYGLIGRNKILNGNEDIKSIRLDSGVEITIEQIKEIYEYIKSKN